MPDQTFEILHWAPPRRRQNPLAVLLEFQFRRAPDNLCCCRIENSIAVSLTADHFLHPFQFESRRRSATGLHTRRVFACLRQNQMRRQLVAAIARRPISTWTRVAWRFAMATLVASAWKKSRPQIPPHPQRSALGIPRATCANHFSLSHGWQPVPTRQGAPRRLEFRRWRLPRRASHRKSRSCLF